ncbi:MAG: HAMP domain-containing sensor histidine kinase [Candidatus Margulisbacteria bacterium]|nr:HAMP domain-containing sensor histidine kinase [Candidatus Margulisiibacteriota bacterium]
MNSASNQYGERLARETKTSNNILKPSPILTFVFLLLFVFIAELISMFVINIIVLPNVIEALIDSAILMAIVFPALYFLVYQPLRESNNHLLKLERFQGDLTQLLVHDLKNPLSGIVSTSEMFVRGMLGSMTEEQKKYLNDIEVSSLKLSNLIQDLLDIGKMEEDRLDLKKSSFSAADLFEDLVWICNNARLEEKNVDLCAQKDTRSYADLNIHADRALITRVLENLLTNAIKHISRGGNVTLRIARQNNEILFEIIDTGEGIPKEYLDKLFNRFFKVETQNLKTRIDTGLGLYFCKLAVEAHGGRIGVESTVGKGSRFYFFLPQG